MLKIRKNVCNDSLILDSIIILIGLTVLTQFFTLLFYGIFSPTGFAEKIIDINHYVTGAPLIHAALVKLLEFKTWVAPIYGLGMLCTAICLILLIERKVFPILAGMGYLIAWALLWHYPGMWTFEFLFPALFGICTGLSKLNTSTFTFSFYKKLSLSVGFSTPIIFLFTSLLWYVTYIALNDKAMAAKVASGAAFTFLLLSFIGLGIDKFLSYQKFQEKPQVMSRVRKMIVNMSWVDIIVLTIGAMMVMQVYADYFSGLYSVKGYADLVQYYSTASGNYWVRPFLSWSAAHTAVLLPMQVIFEIISALFLSLIIFSAPILLLSAGLFGILAFTELGVSANWPPSANNLTWEWELLLVTGVSLLIGFGRLFEALRTANLRRTILGKKIFHHVPMHHRLIIAFIGGLSLYAIGMVTQIFGDPYKIISIFSGVTFFIILAIAGFVDKYRVD